MSQLKWQLTTLVEAKWETPTVKSLLLDAPAWTGHKAGQHVDIRVTAEDGYQAQRSYSIASAPNDKNLSLTVERIEDGEVSPYLVDVLQTGELLELRGPIGGYFVWNSDQEKNKPQPLLLIAGGSGFVPLMAMIRHRANVGDNAPTKVLYSARSGEEIIYSKELEELASKDPALEILYTLTRKQPKNWNGYRRRIDRQMIGEVAWTIKDKPLAFICGPTALVETAANLLQEIGYQPENIKTERFGPTGS